MSFARESEIMAEFIFGAYLIWVSVQDYREMCVIRYSHLLGLAAVMLQSVCCLRAEPDRVYLNVFLSIILLVLQLGAYRFRLYGTADIFVFFLCGIFLLNRFGADFLTAYFLIQALSGGMLMGMQFMKRNVKGLHLRRPVAYIPYISVAFILTNMVL